MSSETPSSRTSCAVWLAFFCVVGAIAIVCLGIGTAIGH